MAPLARNGANCACSELSNIRPLSSVRVHAAEKSPCKSCFRLGHFPRDGIDRGNIAVAFLSTLQEYYAVAKIRKQRATLFFLSRVSKR